MVAGAVSDAHAASQDHDWIFQAPDEPVIVPGDAGKLLVNLLTEDHSHADERGRHRLMLEGYGYRWYRVGGLDYLLKRSDIDTDATGRTSHPA